MRKLALLAVILFLGLVLALVPRAYATGPTLFGNDGALTNTNAMGALCFYGEFLSPATGGGISEIFVGLKGAGASYTVEVGVYSADGSTLLSSGSLTATVHSTPAYLGIALSSVVSMTASTDYWLAVTTTSAALSLYTSATTGGTGEAQAACTSLAAPIGTVTTNTDVYDIYAYWELENTYSASSALGADFPVSGTVAVDGTQNGIVQTGSCPISVGGTTSASASCWFDDGSPVVMQGLSTQGSSTEQFSALPLTYDLLGSWPLQEGAGTNAFDSSGNALTGTFACGGSGCSDPSYTSSNCYGSQPECLLLASTSTTASYVSVAGAPSESAFTAVVVTRPTSIPSSVSGYLWSDGSTETAFRLPYVSATLYHVELFLYNGATEYACTTTASFEFNRQQVIAVGSAASLSSSSYFVDVNGTSYATNACAPSGTSDVVTGTWAWGSSTATRGVVGTVSYAAVYSAELTQAEVQELSAVLTIPSVAFSDATGGNTHTVSYYQQFADSVEYTLNYGGSLAGPVLTGVSLGSTSSSLLTFTTSAQTVWLDSGSAWSTANPSGSSNSNERLYSTGTISGTTSSSTTTTIDPTYYHQYSPTYQITAKLQADFDASLTLQFVGTQFGTMGTNICLITTTTAATASCSGWVDSGTTITFSASLSGSPENARWENAAGSSTTSTISSTATVNVNYDKQYYDSVTYTLNPSGPNPPEPPRFTYYSFGAPATVTFPVPAAWMDSSSVYYSSAVATINGIYPQATGTISSASTVVSYSAETLPPVGSDVIDSGTEKYFSKTSTAITFPITATGMAYCSADATYDDAAFFYDCTNSLGNATATFGLALSGPGATVQITKIAGDYVEFSVSSTSGNPSLSLVYQMPSGSPYEFPPTVEVTQAIPGAASYYFQSNQYFSATSGNTCTAPCVYVDTVNDTLISLGFPAQLQTFDVYFTPAGPPGAPTPPQGGSGLQSTTTTSSAPAPSGSGGSSQGAQGSTVVTKTTVVNGTTSYYRSTVTTVSPSGAPIPPGEFTYVVLGMVLVAVLVFAASRKRPIERDISKIRRETIGKVNQGTFKMTKDDDD